MSDVRTVLTVMTAVFASLKLTDTIEWPWWLVLSPVWAPIATTAVLCALAVMICVPAAVWDRFTAWRVGRLIRRSER